MPDYTRNVEDAILVEEFARLLGIATERVVDTFGRPCLHVPVEGLQRMHETALSMGYPEVAEDIREMLARAKRVDHPE